MRSIEGRKEGAVTMGNGLAEMHAQRPVQNLVTRSGGRQGGGSETPRMMICSCKQGSKGARLEAQVHRAWSS